MSMLLQALGDALLNSSDLLLKGAGGGAFLLYNAGTWRAHHYFAWGLAVLLGALLACLLASLPFRVSVCLVEGADVHKKYRHEKGLASRVSICPSCTQGWSSSRRSCTPTGTCARCVRHLARVDRSINLPAPSLDQGRVLAHDLATAAAPLTHFTIPTRYDLC